MDNMVRIIPNHISSDSNAFKTPPSLQHIRKKWKLRTKLSFNQVLLSTMIRNRKVEGVIIVFRARIVDEGTVWSRDGGLVPLASVFIFLYFLISFYQVEGSVSEHIY